MWTCKGRQLAKLTPLWLLQPRCIAESSRRCCTICVVHTLSPATTWTSPDFTTVPSPVFWTSCGERARGMECGAQEVRNSAYSYVGGDGHPGMWVEGMRYLTLRVIPDGAGFDKSDVVRFTSRVFGALCRLSRGRVVPRCTRSVTTRTQGVGRA